MGNTRSRMHECKVLLDLKIFAACDDLWGGPPVVRSRRPRRPAAGISDGTRADKGPQKLSDTGLNVCLPGCGAGAFASEPVCM